MLLKNHYGVPKNDQAHRKMSVDNPKLNVKLNSSLINLTKINNLKQNFKNTLIVLQ